MDGFGNKWPTKVYILLNKQKNKNSLLNDFNGILTRLGLFMPTR